MPLDRDDPPVRGRLDRFDEAVDADRRPQRWRDRVLWDGLMVAGVHGVRAVTRRGGEQRARHRRRDVRRERTVQRAVMRDVLLEPAAERDVDQLEPAADAEHGDVALERRAQDPQLERVPRGIDVLGGAIRLAVPVRLDVSAPGEAEAFEVLRRRVVRVERHDVEAGAAERGKVLVAGAHAPLALVAAERGQDPASHGRKYAGQRARSGGIVARSMSSMSTPPEARG